MNKLYTPLNCVVIDDEPLALELMKNYIARLPALRLVRLFEDAIDGAMYLQQNPVDLLFIDINMPDINGIDLIRSLDLKPRIIFTTAYKNYPMTDISQNVCDCLLKPIDYRRFSASVVKLVDC